MAPRPPREREGTYLVRPTNLGSIVERSALASQPASRVCVPQFYDLIPVGRDGRPGHLSQPCPGLPLDKFPGRARTKKRLPPKERFIIERSKTSEASSIPSILLYLGSRPPGPPQIDTTPSYPTTER